MSVRYIFLIHFSIASNQLDREENKHRQLRTPLTNRFIATTMLDGPFRVYKYRFYSRGYLLYTMEAFLCAKMLQRFVARGD